MKKYILSLIGLLALPTLVQAQNNMVTLYNQHWNLIGSRQIPSKLGRDYSKVQLNLPFFNIHAYGGFSAIPFNTASNLNNSGIDKNINRLRPENVSGAGMDYDWFALSYKIEKTDREVATISAMITERAAANLLFSDNLLRLLWKGNKQFAGQRVNLGPLSVNAFYFREYALGGAVPLKISDKFDLRAGIRLKYLQGYGAVYMPKSDAFLFTHPEGRFLDFELDYKIHTASIDLEDEGGNSSAGPFMAPAGQGFGTDVSVTVDFADRFSGSLSVLDLGSITYKTNAETYTARSTVHFEGVEVRDIFEDADFNISEGLEDQVSGEETTYEKFTMPTSTRLLLQGEYNIGATTKGEERDYNKSSVYFTYIQGLRNLPGATTRPFGSLGYAHSFGYAANLGLSLGYGGYNNLAVGSFVSFRAGGWRFGVGSSNLTYFIAKNSATGLDFTFNMGFAFGNSKAPQRASML